MRGPNLSPRQRRRLFWVGLAALAVGVAAALVVLVPRTDNSVDEALSDEPAVVVGNEKKAPLPAEARRVAGEFILTAVARRDLAKSWAITHPSLRAGYTKQEWVRGDIPIVPYPVSRTETAPMSVEESYPDSAIMRVLLSPEKGSDVKPQVFFIGVRAVGAGAKRNWLVDYWGPYASVPIPSNSAS